MNKIERVKERPVAPCVIEDASQLHLLETFGTLPRRIMPTGILMCRPRYYRVDYVINEHMEGNIGRVNAPLAREQWVRLYQLIKKLCPVHLVDGLKQYPDMVFTANAGLPFHDTDRKFCVMSKMRDHQREGEIRHFARSLYCLGYDIDYLQTNALFEGEGDVLWHPVWRVLIGGWGQRSEKAAYEEISMRYRVPVVLLELIDPKFYHLDTAFLPLGPNDALYVPQAFRPHGRALIEAMFPRAYGVSRKEALAYACNGIRIGKDVIMPSEAPDAAQYAESRGFTVETTPMSEYLKAGGAAKCLTLLVKLGSEKRRLIL